MRCANKQDKKSRNSIQNLLNSHANTTKDYNNTEVKRKYLFTSANCDSNILTVSSARGGEHEQLSHHILSIQPYLSQLSFGHEVYLSYKS